MSGSAVKPRTGAVEDLCNTRVRSAFWNVWLPPCILMVSLTLPCGRTGGTRLQVLVRSLTPRHPHLHHLLSPPSSRVALKQGLSMKHLFNHLSQAASEGDDVKIYPEEIHFIMTWINGEHRLFGSTTFGSL